MTDKSLCDSCTNIGCEFQSGIVRTKCAFYMPPQLEPDNCGNYVVQDSTTKNDLEVDWESYKDVDGNSLDDLILEVLQNNFDCGNTYGYKVADEIIGLLPSVTPQEQFKPMVEIGLYSLIKQKYIEREVLDKIRAEIEQKLEQEEFARSVFRHEEKDYAKANQCTGSIMAYRNVLKMLDKYKAESEVEDGNDK